MYRVEALASDEPGAKAYCLFLPQNTTAYRVVSSTGRTVAVYDTIATANEVCDNLNSPPMVLTPVK